MNSKYGVLLAISSLPGNHGIGDFGVNAYKFINFLAKNHYRYWQILPLNPLGPGNSPYMSTCSEAIETRYISLDMLINQGLLKSVPLYRSNSSKVDYEKVKLFKEKYLRQAFNNYLKGKTLKLYKFIHENKWLNLIQYSFILGRKIIIYVGINGLKTKCSIMLKKAFLIMAKKIVYFILGVK